MKRIAEYVYVATDGLFSKIGISDNPERRKLPPIRYEDGTEIPAIPKIVQTWHRPKDSRLIEANVRNWLVHRAVSGWEWLAIEHEVLAKVVHREIWMIDEYPKNKMARCPITLREVWVLDRELPVIPPGMVAYKNKLPVSAASVRRR